MAVDAVLLSNLAVIRTVRLTGTSQITKIRGLDKSQPSVLTTKSEPGAVATGLFPRCYASHYKIWPYWKK